MEASSYIKLFFILFLLDLANVLNLNYHVDCGTIFCHQNDKVY